MSIFSDLCKLDVPPHFKNDATNFFDVPLVAPSGWLGFARFFYRLNFFDLPFFFYIS